MNWFRYALWAVVWFFIHSFVFAPILKGLPNIVIQWTDNAGDASRLAAALTFGVVFCDVGTLLFGFIALRKRSDLQHTVGRGGIAPNLYVGATELMLAARHGRVEAIRSLVAAGAQIDAQDEGGNTALMYAASSNQVKALELLLKHGANSALRNKKQQTVADIAREVDKRRIQGNNTAIVAAVLLVLSLILLVSHLASKTAALPANAGIQETREQVYDLDRLDGASRSDR
jgi:hypothetical protein